MRFHNILEVILGQKSKIKILRVFFRTNIEMTGRQIAELSGLNHRTCQLALKGLEREGVVSMRRAGKSNLFRLKEENYFVKNILSPLFKKEGDFFQLMVRKILKGNWKRDSGVISVVLFGSFVQKKESPDSDVDLFILCQNRVDKKTINNRFDLLNQKLVISFGNITSPYILSLDEFRKKYKENDKLIRQILNTGKVIYGKRLEEVIYFGSKKI